MSMSELCCVVSITFVSMQDDRRGLLSNESQVPTYQDLGTSLAPRVDQLDPHQYNIPYLVDRAAKIKMSDTRGHC